MVAPSWAKTRPVEGRFIVGLCLQVALLDKVSRTLGFRIDTLSD